MINVVVHDWVFYLQQQGVFLGLPLAVGGLLMLLGGWRLWKMATVVSFAALGFAGGLALAPDGKGAWMYGLLAAVAVGVASYPTAKYAIAVLGGVIGAAVVNYYLGGLNLDDRVIWMGTGIGFLGATALSFIDRRQVIIVVTACEGAMLFMSAVVAVMAQFPGTFTYFRNMAFETSVFLPFVLLVPTVIGVLLQMADANRRGQAQQIAS